MSLKPSPVQENLPAPVPDIQDQNRNPNSTAAAKQVRLRQI